MAYEDTIRPPSIVPHRGLLYPRPAHRLPLRILKRSATNRLLYLLFPRLAGLFILFFLAFNLYAQQEISLEWPLTSPSGVIVPSDKAFTNFSTGRSVSRVVYTYGYGAMAGGWNAVDVDPQAYYEYSVAPNQGTRLYLEQFSLELSLGYGDMHMVAEYSYDGFRSQGYPIGQPVLFYTTEPESLSQYLNLTVSYPDTLSIRVYAWGATDRLAEFNNRNVRLEGTAFNVEEEITVTPDSQGDTTGGIRDEMLAPLGAGSFTTPGSFTWTCPAGVTCVLVECWGGGGRGGEITATGTGGGGGGGAYSRATVVPVVPGTTYYGNVGNGSNNPSPGGDSWFGPTNLVGDAVALAKGGNSVPNNSMTGAAGGSAASGTGDVKYNGGNGSDAGPSSSGAGGGGAGSSGPGGNATGITHGTGTMLFGGNGGDGRSVGNGSGLSGSLYGGAGSGERNLSGGVFVAGNGAGGLVIITYIDIFDITPLNSSYCFGDTVTIGISGSELGVSYQLYRDATAVGAPVDGTGEALTFGPQTATGTYTVVVTLNNSGCTRQMNGSVVIHQLPTVIASSNSPICYNTTLNLTSIPSGGTGPYSYGWTGPAGFTSTLPNPSITNATLVNAGDYIVTVTDANGCSGKDTVSVVVRNQLTVSVTPASQTICENSIPSPLFSTVAGGSGPYIYQWQSSPDGSTWSNIGGATGATYAPTALIADTYYRVLVTDTGNPPCGTVGSNAVLVTVNNVTAGSVSASQSICYGEAPASFKSSVAGSGDGTITYQWQSSTTGGGGPFVDIIGATALTYSAPPLTINTWYRRMAISTLNGLSCSKASNVLRILVFYIPPGTISQIDNDTVYCVGENPSLILGTEVVDPDPVNPPVFYGYQWQNSTAGPGGPFSDIPSATGQNYDPPVIAVTTWYRRIITFGSGPITCSASSNVLGLHIYPVPSITASISPNEICEGTEYTITGTATNTGGTPIYVLTYVSGTYVTPPTTQTNTTGIFIVPNPVPPEAPPVGQQHFTLAVTNGDPGACSNSIPVTIDINDIPNITLTASCAVNGVGQINMTGVVTYPTGAVVEYSINGGATWSTSPVFTGLPVGTYTVIGRNSLATSCSTALTGSISDRTVATTNYEICQNGTVPAGQGLTGTSYCFTWGGAQQIGNICTNIASPTYVRSNCQLPPYCAGVTVRYAIYGIIMAPTGTMTIKDCPTINGSYSIYEYPWDPANPSYHFVEWIPNSCPSVPCNCTQVTLDPAKQYVIVLNSANSSSNVCSNIAFVTGEHIQAALSIADVQWYTSPESTTAIYTGSPFNPYGTQYLPYSSCPGSYTFFAGCGTGTCREPAVFKLDPYPIIIADDDTICSGGTTNIPLTSKDNCNQIIDPSTVTYEWTATLVAGSATGFSSCSSNCGSIIAQTITSTNNAVCPIIKYKVRGKVGDCSGQWDSVYVLVINSNSIIPPTPPPDLVVSCVTMVPPTITLTAQHACLGTLSSVGVDSNNGGTGCPASPLIITRTWLFSDACVSISVSQTITVIDDVAPTFTLPPDKTVYSDSLCNYAIHPIYTGYPTNEADNCTNFLPGIHYSTWTDSQTVLCQGSLNINRVWSLTDNCGNTSTMNQLILVLDTIKPTITCPDNVSVMADPGMPYATITLPPPTYSDNCTPTGSITVTWTMTGATVASGGGIIPEPYLFNVGTTTVTYTVTDACGLAGTCSFTVVVAPNDPPDITCPGNIATSTDPGVCTAAEDPGFPTLVSGTLPITYSWLMSGATAGSGTGPITPNPYTFNLGVTTIRWIAANISGSDTCYQTVTVNDNEPPTFTAPGPQIFCAQDIDTAYWNLLAEPLTDILPARPDWHIINGTTELDLTNISDNCCAVGTMIIHWTIDFSNGYPSVSGTGQPSTYGIIRLWGTVDYTYVTHTITYTVEDCNGTISPPVVVNITIEPRPNVIKVY